MQGQAKWKARGVQRPPDCGDVATRTGRDTRTKSSSALVPNVAFLGESPMVAFMSMSCELF